ncbi:MAG: ribonuclease D [Alteromonadaceae bacterium]|nr:MAG: ribonuclease D [Alteromonadaceae bacterium]
MYKDLVKLPIIWVDRNDKLEALCESWLEQPLLAVDTEFMRTQTYYPIPGLIQICDGLSSYLIDPLKVDDLYPLVEVFDNENCLKVLHSCSEDLDVFQQSLGCLPKNMLDTQIAGAFTNCGFSVGFGNITKHVLDVELPKTETRSDWLARPLSESQRQYAALDVEYLFLLAKGLIEKLHQNNRYDWVMAETGAVVKAQFANQDPENSYLRIKSGWKLGERQLAVMQSICRWRENAAQMENVPRNRLIKESAIFDIANACPTHQTQLRNIDGLTDRMIRTYGKDIIDIVGTVLGMPDSELPRPMHKPLSVEERRVMKSLKQAVANVSVQTGIPSEMLLKKKDYEYLIRADDKNIEFWPPSIADWRKELLGDSLVEVLAEA